MQVSVLQVYFLCTLFMKKTPQKHNTKKRAVSLSEALKIKNIRRALRESSDDQLAVLRKHGLV